jgi:hypothetical protein
MIAILSILGLILGMFGCYLTIRKVMFETYLTKAAFSLYEENEELFRWRDKLVYKLGDLIFRKYLIRQADVEKHIRILREGNDTVIGFILILLGFCSQLLSIVISVLQQCH